MYNTSYYDSFTLVVFDRILSFCQNTQVRPDQMLRNKPDECLMFTDTVKRSNSEMLAESSTAVKQAATQPNECSSTLDQVIMQSEEDLIRSSFPQLGSQNDRTDSHQQGTHCSRASKRQHMNSATVLSGDGEILSSFPKPSSENGHTNTHREDVPKRRRKKVCSIPATVRNVDRCLLEVTNNSTAEEHLNIIHRRSKTVDTAAESTRYHSSTRLCENVELDILLTPWSEGRLKSFMRPRHPVANDNLSRQVVDTNASPESVCLTSKVAETSSPCVLAVPDPSESNESLNDGIEADVLESTLPESVKVGGTHLSTVQQCLSQHSVTVNDENSDIEVDVCLRSFWDEGSDPVAGSDNHQGSNGCGVGNGSKKPSKGAASCKLKSKAGKYKITRTTKTNRCKQRTSQNKASSTTDKKKCRSKAENNHCSSSGRKQKGTKSDHGSVLPSFAMTLRPRKKVEINTRRKSSCSSKGQLYSQQSRMSANTSKAKSQSRRIRGKAQDKSKQSSQKVDSKLAPVPVNKAARKCGRVYPKRTSALPVPSSGASDQQDRPSSRTGRNTRPKQKSPRVCLKRMADDVYVGRVYKKQKRCKRDSVAESIRPCDNAAGVCGSKVTDVHAAVDGAVTRRAASKQTKTSCTTAAKKSRSVKRSTNRRVAGKPESEVRKVTSAAFTEDRENAEVPAKKSLQSRQKKCVGDAASSSSSSSVKGKKTRSVDITLLVVVVTFFNKTLTVAKQHCRLNM